MSNLVEIRIMNLIIKPERFLQSLTAVPKQLIKSVGYDVSREQVFLSLWRIVSY